MNPTVRPITEDEKPSARYLNRMLEKQNVTVNKMLHSVEEAVGWFQNNPHPDLIFLDLHLPDTPGDEVLRRLWENTRFFKAGLAELGFNTGISESPITPVIAGESALAMRLSDRLFEEGVFAQGIAFPTVARDKARVRTIVTATHTREELQYALDTFAKVGRELKIIASS